MARLKAIDRIKEKERKAREYREIEKLRNKPVQTDKKNKKSRLKKKRARTAEKKKQKQEYKELQRQKKQEQHKLPEKQVKYEKKRRKQIKPTKAQKKAAKKLRLAKLKLEQEKLQTPMMEIPESRDFHDIFKTEVKTALDKFKGDLMDAIRPLTKEEKEILKGMHDYAERYENIRGAYTVIDNFLFNLSKYPPRLADVFLEKFNDLGEEYGVEKLAEALIDLSDDILAWLPKYGYPSEDAANDWKAAMIASITKNRDKAADIEEEMNELDVI